MIANGNNDFGIRLFQEITRSDNDNFFLSPYSAYLAFSMLYLGASGETEGAFKRIFNYPPRLQVAQMLGAHIQSVTKDLTTNIYNAAWKANSWNATKDWEKAMATLEAAVSNVNMSPNVVGVVNSWVKEKTKGCIESILSQQDIDTSTLLVLANVSYLKAFWAMPFDGIEQREVFWNANGGEDVAQMMQWKSVKTVRFLSNTAFQAVALPYKNSSKEMLVIKASDHADFVRSLTPQTILKMRQSLQPGHIYVKLPQCVYTKSLDLTERLKALGAGNILNGEFANMGVSHLASKVLQNTFVSIDKFTTEAAAVTTITSRGGGPETLTFNSPHLYVLYDTNDDTILFIGQKTKGD